MESSVSDMKYQTDALLWLSRETTEDMDFSPCNLAGQINKALDGNAHLCTDKNIALTLDLDPDQTVNSHPILLQIVLNNLVRNAYQNTFEGMISIKTKDNQLKIINTNQHETPHYVGFGIGLILVKKLTDKLQMPYASEQLKEGWQVTLEFK